MIPERVSLWEFYARLPTVPVPAAPAAVRWPPLPAADFTTFLAACRRHLDRRDFAYIATVYYAAAEATDTWLDAYDEPFAAIDRDLSLGFVTSLTAGCAT
ncbi:hypothetical protein AB0J52_00900 [Spirillospora sp. NPDC049652]